LFELVDDREIAAQQGLRRTRPTLADQQMPRTPTNHAACRMTMRALSPGISAPTGGNGDGSVAITGVMPARLRRLIVGRPQVMVLRASTRGALWICRTCTIS
jgi:hypothetical protein